MRPTPAPLVFVLGLALAISACGDAIILAGPEAEAAFAEAQARVEDGGEINFGGTPAGLTSPALVVDGKPVGDDPGPEIWDIKPEDIDRIEIFKRCRAVGYLGEDGRNGIIAIYTKSQPDASLEMEFDEARAAACEAQREGPREAQREDSGS